ncbi:MAG: terminase, partial [Clostridium sp.]|nr:terminase [Clostridium sp.]
MKYNKAQLIDALGSFTHDPLGFVYFAFPWGEKGTPLENFDGPDEWQVKTFKKIGKELRKGKSLAKAIQIAVASGHGIGKSAFSSILILFAIATHENTRGVVTANTDTQLKSKTWAELNKWYNLFIGKELFTYTATALFSADKQYEKTWRIDAIPWSESNPEAFAGLHNQGNRILIIFDEASAISDKIWEVTEGALTDKETEIIWCVFGNPTRNSGRFRECFRKHRAYWTTYQIDSRTVKISNKAKLQEWVEMYRVGEFNNLPVIIGVDPAWTGGDTLEIVMRNGYSMKCLATIEKNDDDMRMANLIAQFEDEYKADAVFIDQGYGTGIYSIGKSMGRKWRLVAFGGASPNNMYLNMRAYMWGEMKEWLKEGGAIPNEQGLYDDLVGPEAIIDKNGRIQLESKKDM